MACMRRTAAGDAVARRRPYGGGASAVEEDEGRGALRAERLGPALSAAGAAPRVAPGRAALPQIRAVDSSRIAVMGVSDGGRRLYPRPPTLGKIRTEVVHLCRPPGALSGPRDGRKESRHRISRYQTDPTPTTPGTPGDLRELPEASCDLRGPPETSGTSERAPKSSGDFRRPPEEL